MNSTSTEPLRSVPASEARELLKEQRLSSLNIAAFARSKGVKPWSLYNAQAMERRRSRKASSPQLAEVQIVDPHQATKAGAAVELALPSGISLRLTRDFDEVALRRVLGVLGTC
jgi:hypothetical protein